MKIIQLTCENVKKLTAVEIRPDGNVVQITGKNGQGKTSVLDAIWWAFTGTENIQKQPIRNGEESARIEILVGSGDKVELIVERRFTESASYLSVKTTDGAKYPSPQKMLDDLLGSLTFDPLAFMRQDARGQFDVLRRLVKLDIDPDALDRLNKVDFEKRTGVNRDVKAKRAQALAISVPEGLPETAIDETELLDRIEKAAQANADIERRKGNRQQAKTQIDHNRGEIQKLRDQAAGIVQQADALAATTDKLDTDLNAAGPLPDPVDISAVRAELETAKATNAHIGQRTRRAAIVKDAETLEAEADALTKGMEDRSAQKLGAIEKAEMPVTGLSFGDGTVTFGGLPLDQASDAEQLTISMAIAAALNPKLRVLRIRDGSLLDDDAMGRLAAFATERDMQIWIERVDGSGTVGFVMEDGHVKGQTPPPAAEKAKKKVTA